METVFQVGDDSDAWSALKLLSLANSSSAVIDNQLSFDETVNVSEQTAAYPPGSYIINFYPSENWTYPGGSFDADERPTTLLFGLVLNFTGGINSTAISMNQPQVTVEQIENATSVTELEQLFFAGNDVFIGNAGNDTIHILSGDDQVSGGAGDDNLDGGSGRDFLFGNQGNDTLLGGSGWDFLYGELGNDFMRGGSGGDTLGGGDGDDIAYGGKGRDLLAGGMGDDLLIGNSGNDRIIGGSGRDILVGGSGQDVFVFKPGSCFGSTTISDFKHGLDKIGLGSLTDPELTFLGESSLTGYHQVHFKYVGHDTLVEVSTTGDASPELSILLKGHIALTANDFIL